jgi:hypothetical protein
MNMIYLKAALISLVLSVSGFVNAGIIWDNGTGTNTSWRGAGTFLATTFLSDTSFTLNQIDQYMDTNSDANIRFAIFNADSADLLFYSNNIFHIDNGMGYVSSTIFNFDIIAGVKYSIAAITDTGAEYRYTYTDVSMNGISNPYDNQNGTFGSTFSAPILNTGQSCCNGNIRLHTGLVSVPEPSTLAIFALGMIGLASRRFKKQS